MCLHLCVGGDRGVPIFILDYGNLVDYGGHISGLICNFVTGILLPPRHGATGIH